MRKESIQKGIIGTVHVKTREQVADALTKPLRNRVSTHHCEGSVISSFLVYYFAYFLIEKQLNQTH